MHDMVLGLCINRYECGLRVSSYAVQICNTTRSDAAAPGATFHIAVFGINGPIAAASDNAVWFREARVAFFSRLPRASGMAARMRLVRQECLTTPTRAASLSVQQYR
jgi:hypothetical protein